jgi:TRAP-type mannitol/chloroaromatic compound transport system permease small subunit
MALVKGCVGLIDGINEYCGRLVALLILVLVGLVMMEVVLRYGFTAPTIWGTELITFLFAAMIMLGGGYTLLHRDHVNVDLLHNRFSVRGRAVADCLTAGFALLYCAVVVYYTASIAFDALATGRRTGSDWNPPLFPVMIALPIGASLLFLQALAKFVRDLHMAFTGRELGS